MYAPAIEPRQPTTTAMMQSIHGFPVVSCPLNARKPAGIITTSLGKGMNELSIVMKMKISRNPHTGAYWAMASRCAAICSVIKNFPFPFAFLNCWCKVYTGNTKNPLT